MFFSVVALIKRSLPAQTLGTAHAGVFVRARQDGRRHASTVTAGLLVGAPKNRRRQASAITLVQLKADTGLRKGTFFTKFKCNVSLFFGFRQISNRLSYEDRRNGD